MKSSLLRKVEGEADGNGLTKRLADSKETDFPLFKAYEAGRE
jgi:hypothetical protein